MRRRAVLGTLAACGLGALAGCSGPAGSLRLTAVETDAALADTYARETAEMPDELRELVVPAIEGTPQTTEGTHPRFESERPIEHEGSYYRIDREIIETHTEIQYVIEVDYDPEDPIDGATVAYEDLPAADRAALEGLIPPREDPPTGEGFDYGRGARYPRDADTALVPEPEYAAVAYEGTAYPITVDRAREIEVNTYEYVAREVASSSGELAAAAREQYLFTLSGVSEDERAIVETAAEDGYQVDPDEEPPAAFESLVERFLAHVAIDRDRGEGEWLVRYDGTAYWADLRFPIEWDDTDTVSPPSATPPPEA